MFQSMVISYENSQQVSKMTPPKLFFSFNHQIENLLVCINKYRWSFKIAFDSDGKLWGHFFHPSKVSGLGPLYILLLPTPSPKDSWKYILEWSFLLPQCLGLICLLTLSKSKVSLSQWQFIGNFKIFALHCFTSPKSVWILELKVVFPSQSLPCSSGIVSSESNNAIVECSVN